MSEITASQAREITDKHEYYSNELWYSNFKDGLFEIIKAVALKGNNSIKDRFQCTESQAQYLKVKLESLGYTVKLENKCSFTISW